MNLLAIITVVTNIGFTVGYDTDVRCPRWVAYDLDPSKVVKTERKDHVFGPDPRVPDSDVATFFRETCSFDLGHMCPAADMNWNPEALRQTYYFTNVCPQYPHTNRGAWLQTEREVRRLAESGTVHVVILPLDLIFTEKLGPRYCAPMRFLKIAYGYFGAKVWDIHNDRGVMKCGR